MKTCERKKEKLIKDLKEKDIYADRRNYDLPPGFGNVYVKFLTQEAAMSAARQLNGIQFGTNICETAFWLVSLYDEDKFEPLPAL
jgi:hypothetical protein